MKYAFFILISLLFVSAAPASARGIYSFKDSNAIMMVAQLMYDVAEDIPVSSRLTDEKINVINFSECIDVRASDILSDVEKSINRVLRIYPDEEAPFEQAMLDLTDYLDNRIYKKCVFEYKSTQSYSKINYYTDMSDKIYLRLDNVALTVE